MRRFSAFLLSVTTKAYGLGSYGPGYWPLVGTAFGLVKQLELADAGDAGACEDV